MVANLAKLLPAYPVGLTVTNFTQSLGAELLTNGDFANWTGDTPTNWTETGSSGANPNVEQTLPNGSAGVGAAHFVSNTNNVPFLFQQITGLNKIFEVTAVVSAYASGTVSLQDAGGVASNTREYTAAGTYKPLFYTGGSNNGILIRTRNQPSDFVVDSISYKEVTRNIAVPFGANGTFDFEVPLPVSPVAGQEVHVFYRMPAINREFTDGWDMYLRRNQGNSAWDFRVDTYVAGVVTNRIAVTGVGTPDGFRVVCSGTLHTFYTRVANTLTQRGSQLNISLQDTSTLINTVYSSAITPTRLSLAA